MLDLSKTQEKKIDSKGTVTTILQCNRLPLKQAKEKTVLINFRIKESIRNEFKNFAEQQGYDMTELLKNFIFETIGHR